MKTNGFFKLLSPSFSSGVASVLLAVCIFASGMYGYLSGDGAIYNFLLGSNSSTELINQSRNSISEFSAIVFGNAWLNKILYFGFWMVIGLFMYLIVHYFLLGTKKALEDIEETTYRNTRIEEMLTNLGTRLAIRVIFIISWLIYWQFFIKTLVPYCFLEAKAASKDFPTAISFAHIAYGLLLLTLGIYAHVVFMRLIALRARLFGNSYV